MALLVARRVKMRWHACSAAYFYYFSLWNSSLGIPFAYSLQICEITQNTGVQTAAIYQDSTEISFPINSLSDWDFISSSYFPAQRAAMFTLVPLTLASTCCASKVWPAVSSHLCKVIIRQEKNAAHREKQTRFCVQQKGWEVVSRWNTLWSERRVSWGYR